MEISFVSAVLQCPIAQSVISSIENGCEGAFQLLPALEDPIELELR